MDFKPIPCHESLRPFIRNYWMLKSYCTAMGVQKVFSNGAASLHFYLSQSVRLDCEERYYRTILFHQNMQTVGILSDEGRFDVFGVEFVPFCSRIFFRAEIDGVYVSPEELHDEEFVDLSKRIYEVDSVDERVVLLDEFFLKRLSEFPEGDVNIERLNDVFKDINHHPSVLSHQPTPSDLASMACLSQKQFTRVFNKYVGMNPKSYLRLLRFHKALLMLQREASASSGNNKKSIAWQCGYYDLAHMISDFRDICGYSPSELIESGAGLTETFGQHFSGLMKKKIKVENLV